MMVLVIVDSPSPLNRDLLDRCSLLLEGESSARMRVVIGI